MEKDALQRRLTGMRDSRSKQGIMSRGANVYKGGAPQARTGGGPNIGRPPTAPPEMETPEPAGVPSLSEIVQRMSQLQPPGSEPVAPYSLQQNQPVAPGMGGVGGSSGMATQEASNPMMPGQEMQMGMGGMIPGQPQQPGFPNPNAIARRLGVR